MRVSVVIPAYNGAKYLTHTLESVRNQTVSDWELVIVDDGSTDTTAELALAYTKLDPRMRMVRQENMGAANACNRGFRDTDLRSNYVAFLDHDDVWESDALETLVTSLQDDPEAAAAYGLPRLVDSDGLLCGIGELEHMGRQRWGVLQDRLVTWPQDQPVTFAVMAYRCCIHTGGQVLIRRKALEEAGPFDPATSPCQDWDMWLRLCQRGHFRFVDKVILNYRWHQDNISHNRDLVRKGVIAVRRKLLATADEYHREAALRALIIGFDVTLAHLSNERGASKPIKEPPEPADAENGVL